VFKPKIYTGGFAALLLVITLSLSIMLALVEAGDSTWRLRQDVLSLGDRTQRQLAAEACRQMALLYIAEDPDYAGPAYFDFGSGIACNIVSIIHANGNISPFADRIIETTGNFRQGTSTMISVIEITNKGPVEKSRYFK
jgi:hypothetical protein